MNIRSTRTNPVYPSARSRSAASRGLRTLSTTRAPGSGPSETAKPSWRLTLAAEANAVIAETPRLGTPPGAGVPLVEYLAEPGEGRVEVRVAKYAEDDQALPVIAPLLGRDPVRVPLHADADRVLVLGHREFENLGLAPGSDERSRHAPRHEDRVGRLEQPDGAEGQELGVAGPEAETY